MSVTTDFLNRAILGLDHGNVWIAFTTSSGVQIIPKECCLLRFFKYILRCFGCDMYSHINAKSVLEHLKPCDWTEIDTQLKDQFYSLFAKRIHNKLVVEAFKPAPPEQRPQLSSYSSYFMNGRKLEDFPINNFEKQSVTSPPLTRGNENPPFDKPLELSRSIPYYRNGKKVEDFPIRNFEEQSATPPCLTRTNQSPLLDESEEMRFHGCDSAFCITEKLENGQWLYSDRDILYMPQGEQIRTNPKLRSLAEATGRQSLLNLLDQNKELMARVEMNRAHYI